MVRQFEAQELCDCELRRYQLWEQGWRTNFTKSTLLPTNDGRLVNFVAYCHYDTKRIVISVPHLNARSEADLIETIKHEVAHALAGYEAAHGPVWEAKCKEIGYKNPTKTCKIPSNIDAGRAINTVETVESPQIKAINNYCPVCFKVAIVKSQCILSGKLWVKLECGHLIQNSQIKSKGDEIKDWISTLTGKSPYPFQVEGIKFIGESNGRCLIADEPGLGKTIQALGALKFYPEMRPALWVCKSTLKLQAVKECLDWCGFEIVPQIIEHTKYYILPNMGIYLVSMDLLRNFKVEKLEEIKFNTVVADEIQHFKNPDSTRTAELRKLVSKAKYFIALSGTPWKNRGSEYFPVLNMLKPELFPSPKHFRNKWVDMIQDPKTLKYKEGGIRDIPAFRKLTESFIIRRMRDDVLPDLPKTNRNVRFVDMEEVFAKSYNETEGKLAAMIKAAMIDGKPMKDIAQMIMQLKHITGLAKVKVVIEDAQEWLENSEHEADKITIFHHHIDVGNNLQSGIPNEYEGLDTILEKLGFNKTLRLYGGKTAEERNSIVEKFKNDPKSKILIASTLASGEGLNLQFCQNAFMMERQWNPQNEEQAELRFSRPLSYNDYPKYLQEHLFNENKDPKKVSIRIPYFIAAGTVDEILTNIVEKKRLNFRRSMNVGEENILWDDNAIIKELAEAIIKKRYKKVA